MGDEIRFEYVEKLIADVNKITEDDYKREHIFMWEFVINRIKDASLSVSNIKNVCIQEVKEEYLQKVKARLEERKFLGEKNRWLLKKINKGIQNNCWACQYALDESSHGNCFTSCPLLKTCEGKLEHNCVFSVSEYYLLNIELLDHNWDKALKLATVIKDAWREIK